MKRFASHYLFLPGYGYLKQYVVEIEGGHVMRIFPLTEEVEGTEWFPGVIALLMQGETGLVLSDFTLDQTVLDGIPHSFSIRNYLQDLVACLFYPYDFAKMQPMNGKCYRQLL